MKKYLVGTFYYGISSIIGKAIGLIMLPIYTSILSPTDYGVAAFLTLYVTIAQLLFGSRMDQAVSKFSLDKKEGLSIEKVWPTALITSTIITLVPLSVSLLFSTQISALLFDSETYSMVVAIFSLNILFAITENYGLLYLRLTDRPRLYMIINLIKLSVQLSLNITLIVIYDYGITGVAISSVAGVIISTTLTLIIAKAHLRKISINVDIARLLIKFSIPLWATALFSLYTGSIHQPLINFFDGTDSLGVFNLASTLGSLIVILFWQPFLAFWQVERFKFVDTPQAKTVYPTVFIVTALISVFASNFIGMFAFPLIDIMASQAFLPAYEAAYPLAMSFTFTYLTYYMNFPFLLNSQTKSIFTINVYSAISLTLLLIIAALGSDFVGIAYALMINNFLTFIYTGIKSQKLFNMGIPVIKTTLLLILSILMYKTGYYFIENTTTSIDGIIHRSVIFLLLSLSTLTLFIIYVHNLHIFDFSALKQAWLLRKQSVKQ